MAYIVRTFIYRYFKNYLCSVTGLFFICLYIFALVFPFLFAISTGEFWQKVKVASEQTYISLNGNYSIQCHSGFLNETSSNIISVTDQDYIDFQYINEDQNLDGKTDFISFQINFMPSFIAEQCTLILFSNVGIRNTLKLQMITPLVFSFNEDFENYAIHLFGQLQFQQKQTLPQLTSTKLTYYNEETNYEYPFNLFDFKLQQLSQNETVIPIFESFKQRKAVSKQVQITGQFKIQSFQQLYYKSTVIQSFREVWIQYIYIAIPTFYLISKLGSFALQKKIFFAHQQVYNDQYNTI
ncbi:unnamed protein product [Paramecium primaurelia]|uniref:Transmembrane protein 231 n=2 Tax=Paramecium TaxID=5884 RepID=A0A8S1UFY3_9CILI|nr:unnamed protein product [Paramecium primaurelia]CAD8163087.1 unnamed protein product [Paramecium pentaurelia]